MTPEKGVRAFTCRPRTSAGTNRINERHGQPETTGTNLAGKDARNNGSCPRHFDVYGDDGVSQLSPRYLFVVVCKHFVLSDIREIFVIATK